MQIEELPLKSIRPYEKNPRNNDASVDAVAESIREFGFRVPIVIDKAGVIVAGHTRAKAAKKLGLKTVPCVRVVELSEEQVRAFRLADNSVSELSTWDFGLLKGELSDISAIDMGRFNFFLGGESERGAETDDKPETGERGSACGQVTLTICLPTTKAVAKGSISSLQSNLKSLCRKT